MSASLAGIQSVQAPAYPKATNDIAAQRTSTSDSVKISKFNELADGLALPSTRKYATIRAPITRNGKASSMLITNVAKSLYNRRR